VPASAAEDVLNLARRFEANDRTSAKPLDEKLSLAEPMRRFDAI